MGLVDAIRQALGIQAESDATRDADPEDLFGMSTAYVTMEADLDYRPAGEAALCFGDVDSTDFGDAVDEVRAILDAGEAETGTVADFHEDDYGYQWVVLREATDFEDLVTSVHFAADTMREYGYGSRLLAAVFAFEGKQSVYWIYSFRRGAYYPFVPAGENERDSKTEFKLQSVLDGELDVEADEAYWYPLWPDTVGAHPWE
ncbi:PspA-associated protein PspAB [Halobacteriales archaeon Cl-PHB]